MQGRDKNLGKSEAIPGQFEWENDFSTYAKENNLKSKKLSDEENEDLIIGQAFEMFLAGIGTSSSLFSCVTYFLAKEQNHQKQVYQEIKEAVEKNSGSSNLSMGQIGELRFLDAFIKESLRLKEKFKEDTNAQGDFIERVCVKDYFLPNLHSNIPKGMRIQVA